MKDRILLAASLVCLLAASPNQNLMGQEKQTFEQLKFEFQVRRAEIQKKSLDEPQAALNAKYQGFLLKLKDTAAAKGDLDQAIALTKAIEEFAKGTPPDASATLPDLKRAQDIHRTESATIRATHAKELRPLIEAYQKRLGDLVTELTKAKQLDAALAVRQESEAMTALLAESGAAPSAATAAPGVLGVPVGGASTAPLPALSGMKQGKLNAKGYFYGGNLVEVKLSAGSNRFVSVLPTKSGGWVGLRPNGSVATEAIEEVAGFRGRIVKLGPSELGIGVAGIDSSGKLQIVGKGPNVSIEPVPKFDKKVVDFSITSHRGGNGFLALLEDGTVKYWGTAYESPGATLPPAAALLEIQAVLSQEMMSYALRKDGTVVAWKYGVGEIKVPYLIRDIVEIAAGIEFAVARNSKGEVLAWGSNTVGQSRVPENLGPCTAIRASSYVAAARKADGKWVAWGSNVEGLVDQIAALPPAQDIAFFGNNTKGYCTYLLWIE